MEKVSIKIKMKPTPKGRPRLTRSGHMFTPQRTRDAQDTIREAAQLAIPRDYGVYAGPVRANIVFVFKRPKVSKQPTGAPCYRNADIDNCAKLALDALNGIAYKDDRQIYKMILRKQWGPEHEVRIKLNYE